MVIENGSLLKLAIALMSMAMGVPTMARIPRSSAVVHQFKAGNPCPVNGATRGPCNGWEVDHVIPLCAGGPDTSSNLQWLRKEDHRQKTKVDVLQCRLRSKQ
jgi:hypothetical protein